MAVLNYQRVPSGKRLQKTMERSTILLPINYFYGHVQ